MNIQQALNQSLLSAATATYFASDIIDKGKQSAIDKHETTGAERTESDKQLAITQAVQRDVVEKDVKKHAKELGLNKMTPEERKQYIDKRVENDPKVMSAKERADLAYKNFQNAERNLKRWDLDRDEVDSLRTIRAADWWKMQDTLDDDIRNARADAKALKSQQRNQETYVSQEDAMKERIDTLHNKISHSNINPNPSIRMEVE